MAGGVSLDEGESKLKVFITGDHLVMGFWPYASASSNDNANYLPGPQFPQLIDQTGLHHNSLARTV